MENDAHTILVADADASFRSFLGGLLRPRGLNVIEARGVWDVWPALERNTVALFIIDAQVPDAGGVALVGQLRKRKIRAPILFVASSWQGVEVHGRLTNKLGVQRVLHKPFSAYQFIMEVESTLEAPKAAITSGSAPPPRDTDNDVVPRRLVSEPSMSSIDAPPSSSETGTTIVLIGELGELAGDLRTAADHALVHIAPAEDADDAARIIARRPVDGALVLLQTEEPDIGFAEATELACSEIGKGLPIGFVSSNSDVALRMNAIQAGGVVHLTPPFRTQDIHQAADAMTQLRRERSARVIVVADPTRGAEIGAVLRQARLHVTAMSDAYRLLDHLHTTTPDVILFDIDLPGVSGLDVCKLLRASPSWRALALMLMATQESSEARIAAFDAGADDFMVKPLDEEELVARVEARVRRHRAVRDAADRDPITGLLSRHAFVERARATLAAAQRSADAVAFCVIRIDDYPVLREHHDALTCERAILEVGRAIASALRDYDLRTRWSDSELLLALVNVDTQNAKQLFRRLGRGFSAIHVRNTDDELVQVTISAGAATHPDDAQSLPSLVHRARKRLKPLASTQV